MVSSCYALLIAPQAHSALAFAFTTPSLLTWTDDTPVPLPHSTSTTSLQAVKQVAVRN